MERPFNSERGRMGFPEKNYDAHIKEKKFFGQAGNKKNILTDIKREDMAYATETTLHPPDGAQ